MDLTCLLASGLYFSGAIITVIIAVREQQREHYDYATFTSLNPLYIQKDWYFRREQLPLELAAGFLNAISWIVFAAPIAQVAIVLSRGGTRRLATHVSIVVLALAACISECMARLMHLGTANWGIWLSEEYNLNEWVNRNTKDNIGWRTLEVGNLVNYGLLLWIDAFEFLALFGILILIFASVVGATADGGPNFGRCWAGFGLFIALFALADFIASVLRFTDWPTFAMLSFFITIINRLVCIPIFLLVLGWQLPSAMVQHKEQEQVRQEQRTVNRSRHWVDSSGGAPSSPPPDGLEMQVVSDTNVVYD